MKNYLSRSAISKIYAAIVAVIVIVAVIGGAWYYASLLGPSPVPTKKLFTYSSINFPSSIDPAVGSDFASTLTYVWIYDNLVYPRSDGGVDPYLAKSWDTSPDFLTWTFHLRNGAKFHDGSEVTAEDVKFSMDKLLTVGRGFAYLFAPYIGNTTVLDKYTVQFKLKTTMGPFLTCLVRLYIVNKNVTMQHIATPGSYGDYGDYGIQWISGGGDVGSGSYKLTEYIHNNYFTVERFKDYWGTYATNAPDEARYVRNVDATAVKTGIARREIEMDDGWLSLEAYQAMAQTNGVNVTYYSFGDSEFYLMLNNKRPPLDDVHVRKAMSWAMDYQTVVNDIYPGSVLSAGPVPHNLPGHDPNVTQYTRDLDKARAELALSKYANNISQYNIEIHWVSEVPEYEKVAIVFANSMADIGINVKVVKVPWLSMIDEMSKFETSPDVTTIVVSAGYSEAGSILGARYHSKSAGTWEQGEWLQDPVLDAMIEDALNTYDKDARFQKYYAIQEKLMGICPSIFLFDWSYKCAYQSYYIDWPVAKGQIIPLMGYQLDLRSISMDPQKKAEILR